MRAVPADPQIGSCAAFSASPALCPAAWSRKLISLLEPQEGEPADTDLFGHIRGPLSAGLRQPASGGKPAAKSSADQSFEPRHVAKVGKSGGTFTIAARQRRRADRRP
ncbi:hypothetical protein VTN00DRAFT_432 [Thermoascus crustaceus]|uniref:uncharacterized protein n=1 Tax=Thermoascus crustaceus TaxID=5088 RepID=UPI0037427E42